MSFYTELQFTVLLILPATSDHRTMQNMQINGSVCNVLFLRVSLPQFTASMKELYER